MDEEKPEYWVMNNGSSNCGVLMRALAFTPYKSLLNVAATRSLPNGRARVGCHFQRVIVATLHEHDLNIRMIIDEIRRRSCYTVIMTSQETLNSHRFSAYWLRSKCSICSYQLNI